MVLVLDNTGSLNYNEWRQTAEFAMGVLNSFTFGDHAVAAAVIYFLGGGHILAAADSTSGKTVSVNKEDLLRPLRSGRPWYNDGLLTCQGSGLEMVPAFFDHSPRKSQNPHKIVISVTDGEDYCRPRGEAAADKLKNEYDAFFITIGVGINREYDKQWLKNISSHVGGNPSYYPVDNYNQIKTLVDKLFSPICDEYNPDYGAVCKGFRGCGKCFCPNCTTPPGYSDICNPISCAARDGTSNGCVPTPIGCRQKESTKCTIYGCANGECTVTDVCKSTKDSFQYPCQTVSCNLADGSCPVKFNDDFCKQKYKSRCELWQCRHEAGNHSSADSDGCVLAKNVHAECDKLKRKCVSVTCNTDKLACEVEDLCVKDNNKCYTFNCTGNGNSAYCKSTPISRPDKMNDDACTKYSCFNESGWMKDEAHSLDAGKCRDNAPADARTCKTFSCDKSKGCQNKTDTNCAAACANIEQSCWSSASSTLSKCELAKCTGTTAANVKCTKTSTDCTKSEAAKTAKSKNAKNDGSCYSYKCSYGSCEFFEVLPRRVSTKCITWKCVGSIEKGWSWSSSYTTEYTNCKNDVCYERKCDDNQGCIPVKAVCESKSNLCKSYTCNNNKSCVEKNLLIKYDCMHEECASDGTKFAVWDKDIHTGCPEVRNCTIVSCPRDKNDPNYGRCVYTPNDHVDDPCLAPVCNTTTNTMSRKPKCDDGFACTEDKCSVDGFCWSVNIDCYQEINMTDYPCFRAACKEDSTQEKGYRCVRKLKHGAYMDICGRCIETVADSSESSSTTMEEDPCVDEPVLPPIKEGIAAATIACIVLIALLGGGALAGTSIVGTKILLDRARAANNQSAHSNPLFEGNAAEMNNPTYAANA